MTRILIVEHEKSELDAMVRKYLFSEGVIIDACGTLAEAMQQTEMLIYDYIVVERDIITPEDGFQFVKSVRLAAAYQESTTKDTTFILLPHYAVRQDIFAVFPPRAEMENPANSAKPAHDAKCKLYEFRQSYFPLQLDLLIKSRR